MPEKIPTWLLELEKWENAEYDGIKGSPPEWVPQPYKKKFLSARNTLCHLMTENKVEYHEIKSRFDSQVAKKYHRIIHALLKEKSVYDESLFILIDLFKIVSLGAETGLVELSGEDGLLGFKRRSQLTAFANKFAEENHNIQEIKWDKWRLEADKLRKANPYLAGNGKKSELARRIKKNLNLDENVQTIRKRI